MTWSKVSVLKNLAAHQAQPMRRSNEDIHHFPADETFKNLMFRKDKSLTPAAVLVPLINRLDEVTVLLTKRTDHLNNHAGQISFPGGRMDKNDRNPEQTALRETEEEIGLTAKQIEIVGQLDDYVVGTGFIVRPIIGFIEPPFKLTPHEFEVAEVFETPLSFLTNPSNFVRQSREIGGSKRSYFVVQWNDYFIWGATAGMLRNLSQRLWNGVQ